MKLPALLKLFHGVFHVTELRGGQIDRDIFLHRMPRLAKLGDFLEFFRRLGENPISPPLIVMLFANNQK